MSDSGFSLGRNDMVNTSAPEKLSHKTPIVLKQAHKEVLSLPKYISAITYKEDKIALVLVLTGLVPSKYGTLFNYEGY